MGWLQRRRLRSYRRRACSKAGFHLPCRRLRYYYFARHGNASPIHCLGSTCAEAMTSPRMPASLCEPFFRLFRWVLCRVSRRPLSVCLCGGWLCRIVLDASPCCFVYLCGARVTVRVRMSWATAIGVCVLARAFLSTTIPILSISGACQSPKEATQRRRSTSHTHAHTGLGTTAPALMP